MFLFLASLACVAAAETGTNAPCHDSKQSPHLTQRAWVDGDRHCSYRDSVVFESQSREFDKLVGPNPKAKALITGDAMKLSAHEGAVFLEHGAEGEAAASLVFTTKPYETDGGRREGTPVCRVWRRCTHPVARRRAARQDQASWQGPGS